MNAAAREKPSNEPGGQSRVEKPSGAAHTGNGGRVGDNHGKTEIADAVVAKIVGMAAREVPGVFAMGAGVSRAIGAVRERLPGMPGSNLAQGVAVEVGERQTAIDLDLIAEYGVSIPDLAAGVRRNVIGAVEKMCGLEVTEVNIAVDDIHLPGEETDESSEPRVR